MRAWMAVVGGALLLAAPARAQTELPDAATVAPIVLLLVDSSGSMEYRPACACTTSTCTECLPTAGQDTRWFLVTEALAGTYSGTSWTEQNRTGAGYAALPIDYGYWIPHFAFSGTQNTDGILDTYASTIKFGLMTMESIGTKLGDTPLVAKTTYDPTGGVDPYETSAATVLGGWSYGTVEDYTIGGCVTTFAMDNGARNKNATMGPLVDVACGGNPCVDSAANMQAAAASIQTALLATRPFGGSPVAGLLDDAEYYLTNDVNVTSYDSSSTCRRRYVVLITDSVPADDMREEPYACTDPNCPYDTASTIAYRLCGSSTTTGSCGGLATGGVHVIGFNNGDTTYTTALNLLASNGGTGSATFVSTSAALRQAIASIMNSASSSSTTSRSVPATFTNSASGTLQRQHQVSAGFARGTDTPFLPWTGVLENNRSWCNGSTVEALALDTSCSDGCDRYDTMLNDRNLGTNPRRLLTVVPLAANTTKYIVTSADVLTSFKQHSSATVPDQYSLSSTPTAFSRAIFDCVTNFAMVGAANSTNCGTTIDWVHGESTTDRAGRRLGDIVYSSPVIVGPPRNERADEAYNTWRALTKHAGRPAVLYVQSNDGILHAFAVETGTYPTGSALAGTAYTMGEELFGFIPPCVLGSLWGSTTAHSYLGDGTIVVRDVFFDRVPGIAPTGDNSYHTVLLAGVGQDKSCYYALDVSDPSNPLFLWQFYDSELGKTEAAPGLGQATINGESSVMYQRAIAVLPGGRHTDTPTCNSTGFPASPARATTALYDSSPPPGGTAIPPRANVNCSYSASGRHLFVLDVMTGRMVRDFDATSLSSPVTGGVALYSGETGAIATRGYFTDRDGMLWRLDIGATNPDQWAVDDFYDLFHAEANFALFGTSYNAPVVTTDTSNNPVIVVGTGDRSTTSSVTNIIASVREVCEGVDPCTLKARLNWEMDPTGPTGHQVMGPLELMNEYVYFTTYVAGGGTSCSPGSSYIWGVHYMNTYTTTSPAVNLSECTASLPTYCPAFGIKATTAATTLNSRARGPYTNQILYGVNLAQRLNCVATGASEIDPYFGGYRYHVGSTAAPTFELVTSARGVSSAPSGILANPEVTVSSPSLGTQIVSWSPVE